jgi:hypothetical protein
MKLIGIPPARASRVLSLLFVLMLLAALAGQGASARAAATTLYVDQRNPNCTNTGAGTELAPF